MDIIEVVVVLGVVAIVIFFIWLLRKLPKDEDKIRRRNDKICFNLNKSGQKDN